MCSTQQLMMTVTLICNTHQLLTMKVLFQAQYLVTVNDDNHI